MKTYFKDLINLVYPSLCHACEEMPVFQDRPFCTHCMYTLPFTKFNKNTENQFTRHFWGRIPIERGYAMFYYIKGGPIPKMVKRIKYQNDVRLALSLGKEYGLILKNHASMKSIDYIIPVPIHKKKRRIRGYNQAQLIAKGLSEVLEIPILNDVLVRTQFNASQTTKIRKDRIDNLALSFELKDKNSFKIVDKHVLLLDDVMTTGATLEACGLQILKAKNVKLSLATIALGLNS